MLRMIPVRPCRLVTSLSKNVKKKKINKETESHKKFRLTCFIGIASVFATSRCPLRAKEAKSDVSNLYFWRGLFCAPIIKSWSKRSLFAFLCMQRGTWGEKARLTKIAENGIVELHLLFVILYFWLSLIANDVTKRISTTE